MVRQSNQFSPSFLPYIVVLPFVCVVIVVCRPAATLAKSILGLLCLAFETKLVRLPTFFTERMACGDVPSVTALLLLPPSSSNFESLLLPSSLLILLFLFFSEWLSPLLPPRFWLLESKLALPLAGSRPDQLRHYRAGDRHCFQSPRDSVHHYQIYSQELQSEYDRSQHPHSPSHVRAQYLDGSLDLSVSSTADTHTSCGVRYVFELNLSTRGSTVTWRWGS